jgi:hypothetical protein
MLSGGAFTAMGGSLVFAGTAMANDPAGAGLLEILGGMLAVFGGAFLLQGVLMMLAGLGVLLRQQWGRILTLVMAALAILWGLASLSAYAKGASYVAFGTVQIAYAILAFIILIRNGAEFSPLGAKQTKQ